MVWARHHKRFEFCLTCMTGQQANYFSFHNSNTICWNSAANEWKIIGYFYLFSSFFWDGKEEWRERAPLAEKSKRKVNTNSVPSLSNETIKAKAIVNNFTQFRKYMLTRYEAYLIIYLWKIKLVANGKKKKLFKFYFVWMSIIGDQYFGAGCDACQY